MNNIMMYGEREGLDDINSNSQVPTVEELLRNPDALLGEVDSMMSLLESKGPALEMVQKEYEQIYDSLKRAIEGGANTERKVEETIAEITYTREQVGMIKRNTDESRSGQEKLLMAMETMKAKARGMNEDQERMKKELENLQAQVLDFRRALQRGSGWTDEQLKERAKLQAQEDNLTRTCTSRTQVLLTLRQEVLGLTNHVEEYEAKKVAVEAENDELLRKIRGYEKQSAQTQLDKAQAEHRVLDLQVEVAQNKDLLKSLVTQVGSHRNDVRKIETELHEAKLMMERYLTDYDVLYRETQHTTETLEKQIAVNKQIVEGNGEKTRIIGRRKKDVRSFRKELQKVDQLKQLAVQLLIDIDVERQGYERKRDELKADITHSATVEIKSKRKECETQRKQIDLYKREKEALHKRLSSSEKSMHDVEDIILFNQSCIKVLQNEIAGFQAGLMAQREEMNGLLNDKNKYETEAEDANRQYFTAIEQLKLQDMQTRELQRQIADCTARLKQQQNLYEAVRSDRNLYSKTLLGSQQEIELMKGKFKMMHRQIEQLKEEIVTKDHALVKEHFNHHSVDKEKETLRNELTKIKKQIYSSEQMILNQRSEVQKLTQIIHHAEDERQRQQKEYEAIVCERDILGGQLIKRSDELQTVYEKVRLQRSGLRHGECRYQKCLEEMSSIAQMFQKLQVTRDDLLSKIQSTQDLNQAVIKLETQLLHERTKIKALTDEKETSINVHRWRNLESSDPQRFEMVRKIQNLQKRIIQRNQDIIEKEVMIQEKEKVFVEVKSILARQPGPEMADQLDIYQDNLKQKTKQLRVMGEELEMYQQQAREFRDEIQGYQRQMDRLKKDWLHRKVVSATSASLPSTTRFSKAMLCKDMPGGPPTGAGDIFHNKPPSSSSFVMDRNNE